MLCFVVINSVLLNLLRVRSLKNGITPKKFHAAFCQKNQQRSFDFFGFCLDIILFISFVLYFQTDSRDPSASDTDTLTQDAADGDGAAEEDAEMELLYRHHVLTAQPQDPDDANGDGDDDLADDDDDDNNNDYQSSHSASGASTPASVGAVSSLQPRRGRRRQQIADLRNFRDVLSTSSSLPRSRPRSGGGVGGEGGGGGSGGGGDLSRSDTVHRGKRKRCAGSDVLELLAEIAATQDRSPNAEFGSYVATELDKLDERQQRRARFEIHQVLFEIQEEGV